MKKHLVAFVAVGTAALGVAQRAEAQSYALVDAPENVEVRGFAYNGSGCPLGTVAWYIPDDRRALTLIFGQNFTAQASPLTAPSDARKFCQLAIDLDFPAGYSYSVISADYRGFAELEDAVVGTQTSLYYFSGFTGPRFRSRYVGPFSDSYFRRDTLGIEAAVWSPCGASRPLNISTQVAVSTLGNPTGSGMMTVDSIDLAVRQTYGLVWRKCG